MTCTTHSCLTGYFDKYFVDDSIKVKGNPSAQKVNIKGYKYLSHILCEPPNDVSTRASSGGFLLLSPTSVLQLAQNPICVWQVANATNVVVDGDEGKVYMQ